MAERDRQRHQQRHRHESADRAPQPGAEGNGQEYRERIELEPAPHQRGRQELTLDGDDAKKDERRDDRLAQASEKVSRPTTASVPMTIAGPM